MNGTKKIIQAWRRELKNHLGESEHHTLTIVEPKKQWLLESKVWGVVDIYIIGVPKCGKYVKLGFHKNFGSRMPHWNEITSKKSKDGRNQTIRRGTYWPIWSNDIDYKPSKQYGEFHLMPLEGHEDYYLNKSKNIFKYLFIKV